MIDYITSVVNDFSINFNEKDIVATQAAEDLFENDESNELNKD